LRECGCRKGLAAGGKRLFDFLLQYVGGLAKRGAFFLRQRRDRAYELDDLAFGAEQARVELGQGGSVRGLLNRMEPLLP
jgi:hypothetical protein